MKRVENKIAYRKNEVYGIDEAIERIDKYDPVLSADRGFHSFAYETFVDILKKLRY